MAKEVTILITAAEASGDRLAAPIMEALRKKNPHLRFVGVGGPLMQAQGLHSLFPMEDLAVMGITDVLPALPRLLKRLSELKAYAQKNKPALLLTVDGSTFSAALRKRIHPLGIPCIHYVVPKVWAWRQGRVHRLKKHLTHLLAELPLGIELFQSAGVPTTYIGHPSVQALLALKKPKPAAPPTLALLPGSRKGELTRHWPLMLATLQRLQNHTPHLHATVILPTAKHAALLQSIAPLPQHHCTVVAGENRFAALATCTAALAKSGTVTLELAALQVPTVVLYRMGALTHALAKKLVKVPYISLPNILLKKALFPEFIQSEATPENLEKALRPLLEKAPPKAMEKDFQALKNLLQTPEPPAQKAAEILSRYLPRS